MRSRVVLGTGAILASLGVAQLACGQDLAGTLTALATAGQDVNRAAKADRAAAPAGQPGLPSQTFSVNLDGMAATSIVVRVPQPRDAGGRGGSKPETTISRTGTRRPTVACEGMVSVLTEIARRLPPGRCIT